MLVVPTLREQCSLERGSRNGSAPSVLVASPTAAVGNWRAELQARYSVAFLGGRPVGRLTAVVSLRWCFLEISCWLSPKAGRERAAAGQHGDPALGGCRGHLGFSSPAESSWPFLLGTGGQVRENTKPLRAAAVKLLGYVKSHQQAQRVEMALKTLQLPSPRDFDTAFIGRQAGRRMAPQRMGGDQVRGVKMRARVGS